MKLIKKMDIVIIIGLLLLSFSPNIIFAKTLSKINDNKYATVKIEGQYYDNINLSANNEITLETPNGKNILVVQNNEIKMKYSECNDSICVKQGNISKVGQTIICLPHELIIEIKGDESDKSNDMILSH